MHEQESTAEPQHESSVALQTSEPVALSIDVLKRYAAGFVASGLFKLAANGNQAVAQAFVKIEAGQELGIPPFAAMRGINIIEGKPELSAGLMAALVKRSGRYRYQVEEATDEQCIISWKERDDEGKWFEIGASAFTIKEAQRAKLIREGGAWTKTPSDMLFARALSRGFRRYTPELTAGGTFYVEGEVSEVELEPAPSGPEGTTIIDVDPETGEIIESDAKQGETTGTTRTLDPEPIEVAPDLTVEEVPRVEEPQHVAPPQEVNGEEYPDPISAAQVDALTKLIYDLPDDEVAALWTEHNLGQRAIGQLKSVEAAGLIVHIQKRKSKRAKEAKDGAATVTA